jgi:ABC-type transport system substrate-binding protein
MVFVLKKMIYLSFILSFSLQGKLFWQIAVPKIIEDYHPFIYNEEKTNHMRGYLNIPIFNLNENFSWESRLCEKMPSYDDNSIIEIKKTLGNDQIRITLEIKKELKWSDGKDVTGFDMLFSWKVAKSLGFTNSLVYHSYKEITEINVDQVNPKRVYFYLNQKNLAFYHLRHLYLIPSHLEEPIWLNSKKNIQTYLNQSWYMTDPTREGLWFGPATPSNNKEKKYVTFLKNKLSYFILPIPEIHFFLEETVPFDKINEFDIVSSEYNELSYIDKDISKKMEKYQSSHHLVFGETQKLEILSFNTRSLYLKNEKTRSYIARKLDSKSFLEDIFGQNLSLSDSIIHPKRGFINKNEDINKNEELYKNKKINLSIKIPDESKRIQIAEYIRDQLPIYHIEILKEDPKTFYSRSVVKGDYHDMIVYGVDVPFDYSLIPIIHKDYIPASKNEYTGKNISYYTNSELSSLLEKWELAIRPSEKKELSLSIDTIIKKENPFIPLFFYKKAMIVRNTFGPMELPCDYHAASIKSDRWTF